MTHAFVIALAFDNGGVMNGVKEDIIFCKIFVDKAFLAGCKILGQLNILDKLGPSILRSHAL